MNAIRELVHGGAVVLDGAWGTQLLAAGLEQGQAPDRWNVVNPGAVAAVARAYVDAGSEVVLTNTFQSNRLAFGDDAAEIARAGAAISRTAAGGTVRVFGSIGPTNVLVVRPDADRGELRAVFEEQADALVAGGADALVIETMSDIEEAVVALDAARTTGLPVVVSLTFDSGKAKDRTMTGVRPGEAARRLTDAGADAVGANCGMGVDVAAPIVEALAAATDLPVWIKANAGLPELVGREVVYSLDADEYARFVPALIDAGAAFVGGCCGTTPAHIRALRRVVSDR